MVNMQLPDFSLVEEVHFQPRLLRFVTLDGKVYPPEIVLEMLSILPAPRWSMTNVPVWDYLVSNNVIVLTEDTVQPGPAFDEFTAKLKEFHQQNPAKPLKWKSMPVDAYRVKFPEKTTAIPSNGDQMGLFD
jgi:hypothetical protein